MSRSIHTTRRNLHEIVRGNFASQAERRRQVEQIRRALDRKRTIKANSRRRQDWCRTLEAPTDSDSIPIEVRNQRDFVQYPASVGDLRAVLRLLPPGTLDGLRRIVLSLNPTHQQGSGEIEEKFGEPDPLIGRPSSEELPGVYAGKYLGIYSSYDASIWLYAYVYDASMIPDRELRELYLRLQMLETLLHEVAHHWDGSSCDMRGRWVDRPVGKSERSARKRAYQWTQHLLIPYLEHSYPEATQSLVEWVWRHGGMALPLSALVNHPNETIFYTGGAVESLFEAIDRGEPARDARLAFARDLHYAERFDDALRSLDVVLAEYPDDVEARTLQADIYEHQERYEQAECAARAILILNPAYSDAWDVLMSLYRAQGRWRELEGAATQTIERCRADGNRTKPMRALVERTCARIELGDFPGAAADLEELGDIRSRSEAVASLRALLLLRTGRYEDALRMSRDRLQRQRGSLPWCGVLVAVRFEAAHRLGQPQEAGTLSARAAKLLRKHGHGQWIDRLIRDYGLRIWSKNSV